MSVKVTIGLRRKHSMDIDEDSLQLIISVMKPGTSFRPVRARDRYYCEFTHINGSKYLVHRFIVDLESEIVDHKNGNSLDNRKENLRDSSYSRNSLNSLKLSYDSTSGLKHISYKPRAKSFYVRIVCERKTYSKGGFKTLKEAIEHHKKILPLLYPNEYMAVFKLNGYVKE